MYSLVKRNIVQHLAATEKVEASVESLNEVTPCLVRNKEEDISA
jgi:hypothetical protein